MADSCDSMVLAWRIMHSPAGVAMSPRLVRLNSFVPVKSSASCSALVARGWLMPISSDARFREPLSSMAEISSICRMERRISGMEWVRGIGF